CAQPGCRWRGVDRRAARQRAPERGGDRAAVRSRLGAAGRPSGRAGSLSMGQRRGMVIAVKPEKLDEYRRLHAEPWPEMNAALKRANVANYSIFLREPENLLFGYWDYTGADYAVDMKWLGEQDVTRRWLALTDA